LKTLQPLENDDGSDAQPSAVRVRVETASAFAAFLEAIPLPSWIHDIESREILAVNDAFVAFTGHSRAALLGSSTLDLCDPLDRPVVEQTLDRHLASPPAETQSYPTPLRLRSHGRSVEALLSSNAVPAVRPHARLVVVRHVPGEERAASPLAESTDSNEQRHRTLFEACPVAAYVYDATTLRIVAVNEAMIRQYRHEREDLLAMSVLDLVAPDDLETMRALVDDLRLKQQPEVVRHAYTVRHRVRGGAEIDVELIAAPLTYGGAEARLVLHHDVTERKRAEDELVRRAHLDAFRADIGAARTADEPLPAHCEHLAYAMVHHLDLDSAGVWILDEPTGDFHLQASTGDLDRSTAGGTRLAFGETWIGRAAARAAPLLLDTWDPSMRPLEVACAHGFGVSHVAAFPIIVRRRVVGVVTASRTSPFPEDLADILRGTAAHLRDASERHDVERLKAELVSVVSHELRTPLTALRGSIGLLTGGVMGGLPPDVMELLGIAERNTLRLIKLVNDILDLERLQEGKLKLSVQPVRALQLVERSLESVKSFADQAHIAIDVRCVDDVVIGDGDRLVQVLVNLLSNAVKFSPAGSSIAIEAAVEPRTMVFRISDHGRGIPASHRSTIFERFEQVRATDAREKGGTGLGLAISKAIIEQHGGTIGVESEEGAGSTFWFRVPRAEP
jgi:PAS domain S-box-containing protein